jgi:hypothetical protein
VVCGRVMTASAKMYHVAAFDDYGYMYRFILCSLGNCSVYVGIVCFRLYGYAYVGTHVSVFVCVSG